MSSKLSPRQKQKLFRYAQYAILAVIALATILLADWKTLSQQVFNLDVAAKQFPDVITVALKNTLLYTALGFVVGLSGGLLLALMRISSIAPYRWMPPCTWSSSAVSRRCWSSLPSVTVFRWPSRFASWIT